MGPLPLLCTLPLLTPPLPLLSTLPLLTPPLLLLSIRRSSQSPTPTPTELLTTTPRPTSTLLRPAMPTVLCPALTPAPPATTTRQFLSPQAQMPTTFLLILSFPQKVQVYLLCCEISIFLTVFLRLAPFLVPYLPVIPTFPM